MKLKQPLQLAFQGSYSQTQVCIAQGLQILDAYEMQGISSSSELVPCVQALLQKQCLKFNDFDFFSVNFGPGAFTSLRVVVVTVNALSFASGGKIIPVCGLAALWEKSKELISNYKFDLIACMLNAYSGQAFVSIFNKAGSVLPSFNSVCLTFSELCTLTNQHLNNQKVLMVGNGAKGFALPSRELIFNQALAAIEPDAPSVARVAHKLFLSGVTPQQKIIPNYIKPGFTTSEP